MNITRDDETMTAAIFISMADHICVQPRPIFLIPDIKFEFHDFTVFNHPPNLPTFNLMTFVTCVGLGTGAVIGVLWAYFYLSYTYR